MEFTLWSCLWFGEPGKLMPRTKEAQSWLASYRSARWAHTLGLSGWRLLTVKKAGSQMAAECRPVFHWHDSSSGSVGDLSTVFGRSTFSTRYSTGEPGASQQPRLARPGPQTLEFVRPPSMVMYRYHCLAR